MNRDFPGGPVVKTVFPLQGDMGPIPSWGTKTAQATGGGWGKQMRESRGYRGFCLCVFKDGREYSLTPTDRKYGDTGQQQA